MPSCSLDGEITHPCKNQPCFSVQAHTESRSLTFPELDFLADQGLKCVLESIETRSVTRHFVFAGCGTSGRIAWLCAHSYNAIMRDICPELPPMFHYCISGGDEALVLSKELPEDDPVLGKT
jgi:hypothetical protein